MTTTAIPLSAATLPQTSPTRAEEVLLEQLRTYTAEVRDLTTDEWSRPTADCPDWDVRQIAAHLAGELDEGAHLPVLFRHLRAARKLGGSVADGLNVAQLADRADRPGPELVEEIERLAARAARKRRKTPGLVRRRPVPGDDLPPGSDFGYLFDVIYPRDVWMHRIDTARATGRAPSPTAGDRDVVEQAVRDLALAWREPAVVLELVGPGAGRWLIGRGQHVATARTDSVEYLRLLSGRPAVPRFELDGDPTVEQALRDARIAF